MVDEVKIKNKNLHYVIALTRDDLNCVQRDLTKNDIVRTTESFYINPNNPEDPTDLNKCMVYLPINRPANYYDVKDEHIDWYIYVKFRENNVLNYGKFVLFLINPSSCENITL